MISSGLNMEEIRRPVLRTEPQYKNKHNDRVLNEKEMRCSPQKSTTLGPQTLNPNRNQKPLNLYIRPLSSSDSGVEYPVVPEISGSGLRYGPLLEGPWDLVTRV